MLKLSWYKYYLQLKHPFNISNYSRTETPVVFTEINYKNHTGYGEASLPPYLPETQETVIEFLKKVNLNKYNYPFDIGILMQEVDALASGNTAAKASIDIALHDLIGKIENNSLYNLLKTDPGQMPLNCITIGIDSPEVIRTKVKEATDFKMLKVKVGKNHDKDLINIIREETDKPICVDANQGWSNKEYVLEMLHWLKEKNVVFVEQPLKKGSAEDMLWLKDKSPLPLVADEDVQRLKDVEELKDQFHGINIKLMKCTGLSEAVKMISKARDLKLKVLIGCMNESSCANFAAAHIAPLADWVDLDGPFLITNNPFHDPVLKDGRIILTNQPGIGLQKTELI